jgi:Xaa-Pro aminopeptidase
MRNNLESILVEKGAEALLLYSESQKDPNMYYLTKFLAPDPFIFLKKIESDPIIVINQMEYPRAQKQSIIEDVRSYLDYEYFKTVQSSKEPKLGTANFIAKVVKKELGAGTRICVPPNFPLSVADVLRSADLTIVPIFDVVEKARETKDKQEVETIKEIQRVNEKTTSEAIQLIGESDVGNNKILLIDGKPLTVGKIKSFFGCKLLENGCFPEEDIIVSCGPKSSDPHYVGTSEDKLKADQPIILDIYPRSIQKRYWTDMTRTIVKGKASTNVKKMYETVLEAKNASLDVIDSGAIGNSVYNVCCNVIEKAGYQTTRGGNKVFRGMTHGLGHGVGLQIHEGPRLGELSGSALGEHAIVTVEPGVYDHAVGGVRIEDIIEVTKSGYKNLTQMENILEI